MIRLVCCNELLSRQGLDFADQCRFARAVGYEALELAVESFPDDPRDISMAEIRKMRAIAKSEGLDIAGLHWLLSSAPELSITDPEASRPTADYLLRLFDITAELGGRVLVHGSPRQRRPPEGEPRDKTLERVAAFFAPVAKAAADRDLCYCIEPLSRDQTPFINTLKEAARLVGMVGSDHFKTMLDCSSAALAEDEDVPSLIEMWMPTGNIAHIHLNDRNRGAPGTGSDDFSAIIAAILKSGYSGDLSVEPFKTCYSAEVTLAIAAATVEAHLQTHGRK
ncbi:sugar phosphate isomerase/epimerase family protein [Martelella radicis]|uniref:Sugar phosphate isomerase/epimerase n=1 Tax=Martelella radicis TaxID=1397476 RepID=A0A7W6P9V4_9HYPH|nr:sugar phosphate isomerase/epimerase family protein [Martelella radicis]MBB4120939.1 sugar phosphate isomerase/epimerase [Martelella radicis]